MPKLSPSAVPSYCRHKASGQAYVNLGTGEIYLGVYRSAESRAEYNRLVGEWLAAGRRAPTVQASITVVEIISAFWKHCQTYYCRADGTPTGEVNNFREALRPLKRLYAKTIASEFGPLALKALQSEMITMGWSRKYINRQIGRVRHVFKWAAGNEIIPASIHQALQAVDGLKVGRTKAKESDPVKPVPDAAIEAVLPLVSRQLQAMIKLQRLTGMRPGEVCAMRGTDLNMQGDLWEYRPGQHKTAHHGHERVIILGKQALEVVAPFLKPNLAEYLFQPADADSERREALSASRKTPLSCGNKPGSNRTAKAKRKPGECYTDATYCAAVQRACDEAFPPPDSLGRHRVPANGRKTRVTRWETYAEWKVRLGKRWQELLEWQRIHRWHPNQIRHTAGTEFRKRYGLEVAQVLLGHKTLTVTQVYAERNVEAARKVMAQVG